MELSNGFCSAIKACRDKLPLNILRSCAPCEHNLSQGPPGDCWKATNRAHLVLRPLYMCVSNTQTMCMNQLRFNFLPIQSFNCMMEKTLEHFVPYQYDQSLLCSIHAPRNADLLRLIDRLLGDFFAKSLFPSPFSGCRKSLFPSPSSGCRK